MSRGTTSRFTIDASQDNSSPIWSPDGSRIAFGSFRGGKWGLYEKPSNGAGMETRLVEFDTAPAAPMGWSPDGRAVVYWLNDSKNGQDLGLLPLVSERPAGSTSQTPAQSASSAVSLVSTRFLESHGQVSPDGRWLAYSSNETGQPEVYVQPFPTGSGKRQVSTAGGWFPRWRGDGRELFYMNQVSLGKLIAVDVKASGATFEAGAPKALFDSGYVNLGHTGNYHTYAISRDGQRFFIPRPAGGDALQASSPIVVVLNWAQAVGSGQ
jgi:Tol biopolymer transport system component